LISKVIERVEGGATGERAESRADIELQGKCFIQP
jgi:hypothetical protein